MSESGDPLRRAALAQLTTLWPAGLSAPLLLSVSGGPDSIALTHVLAAERIPFEIAHIDHQTRGEGSAEDARFVEALAKSLDVPFHLHSEDIEAGAEKSPMSFEEFARERRYAFLVATVRARGCVAIATGHHADDQAETVLMRVLRGTGPRGIAGTPPVAERDGVRIVRPFLHVRRGEILAWLSERGLRYCHDETNLDTDFVRNRIRHELLPQLRREYNPRVVEALDRLADLARAEDELLQAMADDFLKKCRRADGTLVRATFAEGHRAIQRRAILDISHRQGARIVGDHVERAIQFILHAGANKRFDLGGGTQLVVRGDAIAIETAKQEDPCDPPGTEVPLAIPGDTIAFGTRIRVTLLASPIGMPLRDYCNPKRQVVDVRALEKGAVVRHRCPGDRIAPLGLNGSRKLKDYFGDLGLPPHERDRVLLIVSGDEIIWIAGHAVAQHAAIKSDTTQVAQIEVLDASE